MLSYNDAPPFIDAGDVLVVDVDDFLALFDVAGFSATLPAASLAAATAAELRFLGRYL